MAKRMKRLHRLIYLEILPVTVVGVVILTFIAFSREFQRISRTLVFAGASVAQFFNLVGLIVPAVLFVTLPMALLLGVVICMSRLAHDHEITALKSCGIGVNRLLPPVVIVALCATAVVFLCTTHLVPSANARLRDILVEILKAGMASELKPRVFHDRFRNFVFYIEDSDPATSTWKGIFIVDRTKPGSLTLHLAREGHVQLFRDSLQVNLTKQTTYTQPQDDPDNFSLATSEAGTIPFNEIRSIQAPPLRNMEKTMGQLDAELEQARAPSNPNRPTFDEVVALEVEYHQRLALPFACLALALVGVPLGVGARRGGRSAGIVISVAAVGLYYLLFIYSWKAGAYWGLYPVSVGVWVPNLAFLALAAVLLGIANREIHPFARFFNLPFWAGLSGWARRRLHLRARPAGRPAADPVEEWIEGGGPSRFRLFRIMDRYIVREFLAALSITLLFAVALFTIFTLFELMDYIYKNSVSLDRVAEYFLYVTPMVVQQALPFCVLIAMLVSFGLLEKSNQILVLKASGISVYRIALPVVLVIVLLVPLVFVVQEQVLPWTNRRQDELYNEIKGRKAQSFHHPETSWVVGTSGRIYNLGHFDDRRNVVNDVWIFDVDLEKAVFRGISFVREARWDEDARRWVFQDGWRRVLDGFEKTSLFRFQDLSSRAIEPPAYFKSEIKKADKLSFTELSDYIARLGRKGYNTLGLEVDLHKKISYPLVILVMLLVGLPFAFRMGKKGTVFGIAVSTVIGIVYWALFNVCTAMGAFGVLPPVFAAWAPNIFFGFASLYLVIRMRT